MENTLKAAYPNQHPSNYMMIPIERGCRDQKNEYNGWGSTWLECKLTRDFMLLIIRWTRSPDGKRITMLHRLMYFPQKLYGNYVIFRDGRPPRKWPCHTFSESWETALFALIALCAWIHSFFDADCAAAFVLSGPLFLLMLHQINSVQFWMRDSCTRGMIAVRPMICEQSE